jgi:hypothetical protein
MAPKTNREKQQAHELIERLGPNQVSVLVGLLEALLDPVSRAIANAPKAEEPESDLERRDVAESKAWFRRQGVHGIPHEEVLAAFDVTPNRKRKQKD